jgi:hypothetical protein
VRLSFPSLKDVSQRKHHPWKLDEGQVIQYGLGGVLSPYREWWEYIDCTDRCLNFISMSEDLVMCALVCEDLARPDPVANIVRSVGPNLVIALLMDGPQTKERWAARYATVLADDPGCSVLSLTSFGMARLSRPPDGTQPLPCSGALEGSLQRCDRNRTPPRKRCCRRLAINPLPRGVHGRRTRRRR